MLAVGGGEGRGRINGTFVPEAGGVWDCAEDGEGRRGEERLDCRGGRGHRELLVVCFTV